MQNDIAKLCALSLRAFLKNNHGIDLKSGHAHELVAAFSGYKSAISMRQDAQYPLSNLNQAEYIHFDTDLSLVNQRIKELELDLPDAVILAEGFYSTLMAEKWLVEKVWPTLHDLAVQIAKEHPRGWIKPAWSLDHGQWDGRDIKVSIERSPDFVLMIVDRGYITTEGKRHRDKKFTIKLPRVAANFGYGNPEVTEARYTGMARQWSDEEMLKKYPIPLVKA